MREQHGDSEGRLGRLDRGRMQEQNVHVGRQGANRPRSR
jgi:hypothetical protein